MLAYVTGGAGHFDDARAELVGDRHLVGFGDGERVSIAAGPEGVSFLLVSGKPIGEPIAWRGPIVMNTQAELATAFDELEKGTFIKK